MKKFLCSIGIHRWLYEIRFNMYGDLAPDERRCRRCGKMQKKYRQTTKIFKLWFSEEEIKKQWQKEEQIDKFVKNK